MSDGDEKILSALNVIAEQGNRLEGVLKDQNMVLLDQTRVARERIRALWQAVLVGAGILALTIVTAGATFTLFDDRITNTEHKFCDAVIPVAHNARSEEVKRVYIKLSNDLDCEDKKK